MFFENPYTSVKTTSKEAFQDFTRNLCLDLPQLSDVKREELEGPLSQDQCLKALKSLGHGKSPDD